MNAALIKAGSRLAELVQDADALEQWQEAVSAFRLSQRRPPRTKRSGRYAERSKKAYAFLEANRKRGASDVAHALSLTIYVTRRLLAKMEQDGKIIQLRDPTPSGGKGHPYYLVVKRKT